MSLANILSAAISFFSGLSKKALIDALVKLRDDYKKIQQENDQLRKLIEQEKLKAANLQTNKPSSKQAEWEDKGKSTTPKKRKRKRSARAGAGNKKKEVSPSNTVVEPVIQCNVCGKDLTEVEPLSSKNDRIIEDIPAPRKPEITKVIQEKKYCDECKVVVTSKSLLALPGCDIGLEATALVCYMWAALCLPFTKIHDCLNGYFKLSMSTAGLSRHVIKVADILKSVHAEILADIQDGSTLFADETGWRIRAVRWWLWVFGTKRSAYFTMDKTRGSSVVRRILGEIFLGVLVVDGWSAYTYLQGEKQTCMAHIFRKIRKLRDTFPKLRDVLTFYLKLRRIVRDGERLQKNRETLGEEVFERRLKKLKDRLEELVKWENPSDILEVIIKKVKLQQERILTFVEHPDVPTHNNYAEYLIRIGVLKRKISGGSVSVEGADAYACLLSIYTTCKLRKISFTIFLKESLTHYIKTGTPMSLKVFEELQMQSAEN